MEELFAHIADNGKEQVLITALGYLEKSEMLHKELRKLIQHFQYESCQHVRQAVNVVLVSMDRHVTETRIQVLGSAILCNIIKGPGKELLDEDRIKKRIITTLLDGMFAHKDNDTIMTNSFLTLLHFDFSQDIFQLERLFDILMYSVFGTEQGSVVQQVGIHLLSQVCRVKGQQKIKLGELGAVVKMLWLIADRLERGLCDFVLEMAWATVWNLTDETPPHCKEFFENKGMEYFLKCLEKFPDKKLLLQNMIGLLANVAEVEDLRHHLMKPEYVAVLSDLLDSNGDDDIEISISVATVLSHMASDGPEAWTVQFPSRETVLQRMVAAIKCWDLSSQRQVRYNSLTPILNLMKIYETPECQYLGVWMLANLTKVCPEQYCALVENEGGLTLLQEIINHPTSPTSTKQLAGTINEKCRHYRKKYMESDSLLDG